MPQVSLYVDEPLMDTLRLGAKERGVSLSRYVAERLRESQSAVETSGLPEGYLRSLYGALADDDGFELPERLPERATPLPLF